MVKVAETKWYVRWEGTGEVAGPMSNEEAFAMAERIDGMIFSGDIFSPKIVTIPEVEAVLTEMRGIEQFVGPGLLAISADLLRRAIDTITLLSVKLHVPENSEVEDLLRTARVMQGQVADQPTCERAWLQQVIDAIARRG